jgi:hypothetical protein
MTTPGKQQPRVAPIGVIRTLAVSVLVTPLLFGAVVLFVVPGGGYPPPFLPIVLGAVAVGGVLLAETVGYAAPPIPLGTAPDAAASIALQQYRSRWLVRSASTQVVLLAGLLLSFMLADRWPYVVAFVLGWPIMIYELWPARRHTDRLNQRLEIEGGTSYLGDALHRLPPS